MFKIINGVILSEDLVSEILKEGFQVLGEVSPFNTEDKNIIISRRLSGSEDQVVWWYYRLDENEEFIKPSDSPDSYSIDFRAKEFASVCSRDGFLQINVGTKGFNHLAAIEKYQEITG